MACQPAGLCKLSENGGDQRAGLAARTSQAGQPRKIRCGLRLRPSQYPSVQLADHGCKKSPELFSLRPVGFKPLPQFEEEVLIRFTP